MIILLDTLEILHYGENGDYVSFIKVRVVNCIKASIRKTPWIPLHDKDIVGVRDGPNSTTSEVKMGDILEVDLDNICYDWTGRKFYAVRLPRGWVYEGVIEREVDG